MNQKKDLKTILIKHFDDSYDDNLFSYGSKTIELPLRSSYIELEDFWKSKSLGEKEILDYCCGSGLHSIFPAKLGAKVTGIDFSKNSIRKAKIRALNCEVENNCKFFSGDLEDQHINSISDQYDFILVIDSLLYLNMEQTFLILSKLLKPEGEIIIIEGMGSNIFFNLNRKKNTNSYAPGFEQELSKKTIKEISESFSNLFYIKKEAYFGLFSSAAYILKNKFNIKLNIKFFLYIDELIKKIPFMRKYFFRCFLNLKKINI